MRLKNTALAFQWNRFFISFFISVFGVSWGLSCRRAWHGNMPNVCDERVKRKSEMRAKCAKRRTPLLNSTWKLAMGACKLAARFIVTSKRLPIKTVKGYSECAATRARRRRRPAEDFITCWLVWLALNSVVRKNTLTFTQNNHGRRTLHHNKPVRAPRVAWPIAKNART